MVGRSCAARFDAALGLAVLTSHVHPGALTEYVLLRLLQWAQYLVRTSDLLLPTLDGPSLALTTLAPCPGALSLVRFSAAGCPASLQARPIGPSAPLRAPPHGGADAAPASGPAMLSSRCGASARAAGPAILPSRCGAPARAAPAVGVVQGETRA